VIIRRSSAAILLALALLPSRLSAQAPAPLSLSLSLDEALRLAEERSERVASARAGVLRAQGERLQARSELFPQLNGYASYDRTLRSEYDGLLEAPAEGEAAPGFLRDLPFGQANVWRAGITLTQNLFTGGRVLAGLDLAASGLDAAQTNVASTRAVVVLDVAQAYYDAVLAGQLVSIARASLEQARDTLEQTRLGEDVGATPRFDVLRAQVALEQQRTTLLQAELQRDLAELRFKQHLDIDPEQPVILTTALEAADPGAAELARSIAEVPAGPALSRAPVRQAERVVAAQEASLAIAKSERFPELRLVSNFGYVSYPADVIPGLGEFRGNWVVGLTLRLPLFTGLRITGDIRVARGDVDAARAELDRTVELARLDTTSAERQLSSAVAVWEASSGVGEQAEQAFEIARVRYRAGISTQLELSDARLALQQARATRAQAARDLQLARIRLALLPNLPLGVASGVSEMDGQRPGEAQPTQATPVRRREQQRPATQEESGLPQQGAGERTGF